MTQTETNLEPLALFLCNHPNELFSVQEIARRTGTPLFIVEERLRLIAPKWQAIHSVDGKYVWKDPNRLDGGSEMVSGEGKSKVTRKYNVSGLNQNKVYDILLQRFGSEKFSNADALEELKKTAPDITSMNVGTYLLTLSRGGHAEKIRRGVYKLTSIRPNVQHPGFKTKKVVKPVGKAKAVNKAQVKVENKPRRLANRDRTAKLLDFLNDPKNQDRELTLDYLESVLGWERRVIASAISVIQVKMPDRLTRVGRGIYRYSLTSEAQTGDMFWKMDLPDGTAIFLGLDSTVWEGRRLK